MSAGFDLFCGAIGGLLVAAVGTVVGVGALIGRRLFGSTVLGCAAGLLLAEEGRDDDLVMHWMMIDHEVAIGGIRIQADGSIAQIPRGVWKEAL